MTTMEMAGRSEKSSFSQTCKLLSQFIKEKGSFADLGINMPCLVRDSSSLVKSEPYHQPTTASLLRGVDIPSDKKNASSLSALRFMELFPQQPGFSLTSPQSEASEHEKAQLTIFYGKKVFVFDNFPSNKANQLLHIATKEQIITSETKSSLSPSTGIAPSPDLRTLPALATSPARLPTHAHPNFPDLPIARKASLHRFLQKRRDRISAQTPYQLNHINGFNEVATVEEEISQPWLKLGPHLLNPGLGEVHFAKLCN